MKITDINLRKNPFEDIIPSPEGVGIWAGLKEQKEKITTIYSNAFDRNSRQVRWKNSRCVLLLQEQVIRIGNFR